jgi:hypothetical protein
MCATVSTVKKSEISEVLKVVATIFLIFLQVVAAAILIGSLPCMESSGHRWLVELPNAAYLVAVKSAPLMGLGILFVTMYMAKSWFNVIGLALGIFAVLGVLWKRVNTQY